MRICTCGHGIEDHAFESDETIALGLWGPATPPWAAPPVYVYCHICTSRNHAWS